MRSRMVRRIGLLVFLGGLLSQTGTFTQSQVEARDNGADKAQRQSSYSDGEVLILASTIGTEDNYPNGLKKFDDSMLDDESLLEDESASDDVALLNDSLAKDDASSDVDGSVRYRPAKTTDLFAGLSDEDGWQGAPSPSGNISGSGSQISELAEFQAKLDELQATTDSLKSELAKDSAKKPAKLNDPFTVKFKGQIAMDGVFVSQDDESRSYVGNAKNSINFRDVRITASGSGHGNMAYSFGVSYNNSVKFLHNYVRFKETRVGTVTIGHHFVESGLESVTYSFDRVYPTLDEDDGMFRVSRRIGVSTQMFNTDKSSRLFLGAFCAKPINSSPHYVSDEDPGLILDARWTAAPVYVENELGGAAEVFHYGGSFYWLDPSGDATYNVKNQGLAWLGSNPSFIEGVVDLTDRSYTVSGVELAWQRNGFGTSAEGHATSITNGGGTLYGVTATARLFLTPGCARIYNRDDARFSTVKMRDEDVFVDCKNRTIGHGWGAWELNAKWSWVEANNLKNVPNSIYGSVNRVVSGLNWFWNDQAFMSLDWEHAFTSSHSQSKGDAKLDFDTIVMQTTLRF